LLYYRTSSSLFLAPQAFLRPIIAGVRLLTVTATVTNEKFGRRCWQSPLSDAEFADAPLAQRDVALQFLAQCLRALEILADLEDTL
jgi:hypothetical protein